MSREKECKCCHEWWCASDIKEDLCPNCYDCFKQLKQQLEEKDKEIECWKDKTKNKILNMKTTDFVKMCLSCGIMVDIKQTQTQLAIKELEKVKTMTEWKFNSVVDVVEYIDNQIKELKGE